MLYYAKRDTKQEIPPEFKKMVIETMLEEKLSYNETARRFEVCNHHRIQSWERISLTEGVESLAVERRDRRSESGARPLPKETEEDLLSEVQRLRAEVDYLKNLQALVLEEERCRHKNTGSSKSKAETFFRYTSHNRSITSCHFLLSTETNEKNR